MMMSLFVNYAVMSLFVNYTVGARHFQAFPYRSRGQALIALTNIRRQPGVSNTWLGRSRFYYRKLVVEAA
jgi:hypothetical protein